MDMDDKKIGYCGLVCSFCYPSGGCSCKGDNHCGKQLAREGCYQYNCCTGKGLAGCWECEEAPCGIDMLAPENIRQRAYIRCIKEEGIETFYGYIKRNQEKGILYHRDGIVGDYDKCKTEQEVIELLKTGVPNPYTVCPVYESGNFILRQVSIDDAADLLECYKTPSISVRANAEGCNFGYGAQTSDEMREIISRWLDAYRAGCFIRFAIEEKQKAKTIGTIEIFGSAHKEHSVLRIDIPPKYETEKYLYELLCISDNFFLDIGCERIVTKVIPVASQRANALARIGYKAYPANDEWRRENYYIKKKNQR